MSVLPPPSNFINLPAKLSHLSVSSSPKFLIIIFCNSSNVPGSSIKLLSQVMTPSPWGLIESLWLLLLSCINCCIDCFFVIVHKLYYTLLLFSLSFASLKPLLSSTDKMHSIQETGNSDFHDFQIRFKWELIKSDNC